jgi:glycerophosphoryl diester phosphodiesterase
MRQLVVLAILVSGAWAQTIQVQGHRGARAMRPENTMPAFEYAIAQGVDALELDMAVTKDGVIVVSHDPEMRAPVCTGPRDRVAIHSLTLAEVRQWDCGAKQNPLFAKQQPVPGTKMPTLDEVFTLAPKGRFLFNIETKITPQQPELAPPPGEFARLVLAQIHKHHLESRVVLQSFDFRTLHEMRKIAPEIRRSALYSGTPRDFVDIGREAGAQIVSPEYHLVTAEQVKAAHAAGFGVLPWTANTPEDWASLVAAGVDGIISDDPAALIAYLKKQ